MNIYKTIEETIELIENNLCNHDLNILFLSKRLFISPYYLQRIFYSFIGKTIGTYIRERR